MALDSLAAGQTAAEGLGTGDDRRDEAPPPMRWVRVVWFADQIGIHRSTIQRWCVAGKVPAVKIGRIWYVDAYEMGEEYFPSDLRKIVLRRIRDSRRVRRANGSKGQRPSRFGRAGSKPDPNS